MTESAGPSRTPAVLVDVDGVLNAFFDCRKPRPRCGCHPEWTRIWVRPEGHTAKYKLTLNPAHGPLLVDLAEGTGSELVWASYWQGDANTHVSPVVGLPGDLPFVPIPRQFKPQQPVGVWKAKNVAAWASGRPFVWFEDEPEVAETLAETGGVGPHLVIKVNAGEGLTEAQIAAAKKWLDGRAA